MSNAEKANPEGIIELGGHSYKIVCNFKALCKYEELTGKSPFLLLDGHVWLPSEMAAILTAMLQDNHREMTREKVIDLMEFEHYVSLVEVVGKYFNQGMPGGEKKS